VPEHELVQVGLQMLGADSVVDADDRPLEQRPEALNPHRMHVSVHEGLGMGDGFVSSTASGGGEERGQGGAGSDLDS